ncbi:hypothetical protein Asppvi_004520 [Aspergillus pseudoviridinutans]|uniref:Uncharacterized protein n=1 Tax=Aspergillus pseudoviridinutans TaxID=1517512 RepID=A0A9P3ES07_9EURO|nr:uncharacterized protein Asppvi_004520 [Aspergillus pseudoviridinutans]GIJ85659.1 hypothetical protein Asppvi_004520 [Aspergillus pseudoviridinutans]
MRSSLRNQDIARYMDDLKFLNGTCGPVRSPTTWLGDHELDVPSGKECATKSQLPTWGFFTFVFFGVVPRQQSAQYSRRL